MPISDSRTRLLARKTKWLRLAPLIALGAITIMLLTACTSDEPTQTPESDENQATSAPAVTVELPTPTPTPAPIPTPTVTPTHTPAPLVTPSPTAVPTWDDYGSEALEQLSCETWDGVRDATAIVPAELYPLNRNYHTASLLDNGRILMGSGYSGAPYEGGVFPLDNPFIDVYDPATDSWCSLITADKYRFLVDSIALNDGSLLLLGWRSRAIEEDGDGPRAVRFHAQSLTLTEAAPPTIPRRNPRMALLDDGRVLVAGGWDFLEVSDPSNRGARLIVADAEIYDPATDSWTVVSRVGPEPLPEFYAEDTLFTPQWLFPVEGEGAVLVTVGEDSENRNIGRIDAYDTDNDSWSTLSTFTYGFSDDPWHAILAPGNKVVIFYVARVEIFELDTREWTISYSSRLIPRVPTTTALPDGRILVSGGAPEGDGSGRFFDYPTRKTSLFDPETLIWADGPEMEEARHGHSATVLSDGKVLIYGGVGILEEGGELIPLNTVEVIDAAVLAAVDTMTPPEIEPAGVTCMRASNMEPLPPSTREVEEYPASAEVLLEEAVQAVDALSSYGYVSAEFLYTTQSWTGGLTTTDHNCLRTVWRYVAPDSFETSWHQLCCSDGYRHSLVIGSGGHQYIYSSEDSGDSWTREEARAEELDEILPPHKKVLRPGVEERLTDLRITGVELLDGVDVFHITGDFTYEGTATGDRVSYWIGVDDLRVRRILGTGEPDEYGDGERRYFDELYEFHSFNEDFNIQPPPDDQIAD